MNGVWWVIRVDTLNLLSHSVKHYNTIRQKKLWTRGMWNQRKFRILILESLSQGNLSLI